MAILDDAKDECFNVFFKTSPKGIRLTDGPAQAALDRVFTLTVESALEQSDEFWTKPTLRQFFLRHARWIARVACAYASAAGRSFLTEEDIFGAADEIVKRSAVVCNGPGPGCSAYVDERLP